MKLSSGAVSASLRKMEPLLVSFSGSVGGFSTRDTALQVWAAAGWQAGAIGGRRGEEEERKEEITIIETQLVCKEPPKFRDGIPPHVMSLGQTIQKEWS